MSERESVRVLEECIALQKRKSEDYQNPNSTVKQADYYPNGVATIHDILHAKMLRARSLIESGSVPQNEALEDTYKDLINYASFAVSWLRGKIPGQDPEVDMFNRPKLQPGEMPRPRVVRMGEDVRVEMSLAEQQRARSYPNKRPGLSSESIVDLTPLRKDDVI